MMGYPLQIHRHKSGAFDRPWHAYVYRKRDARLIHHGFQAAWKSQQSTYRRLWPPSPTQKATTSCTTTFYGWAISQSLPCSGFKGEMRKNRRYKRPPGKGHILKVDLEYPCIFTNLKMTSHSPERNPLWKKNGSLSIKKSCSNQEHDKRSKTCPQSHDKNVRCPLQEPPTLPVSGNEAQENPWME